MTVKTKAFSFIAAGMLMIGSITGAAAQTNTADVSVTIQANEGGLGIAQISQTNQTQSVKVNFDEGATIDGTVSVTVVDARFTRAGWNLNVSATDLQGTKLENKLTVDHMTVSGVTVAKEAGDAAPAAETETFTMSTGGTKVVSAAAGTGSGRYNVTLNTSIVVPANTTADTYSSTITFSLATAP